MKKWSNLNLHWIVLTVLQKNANPPWILSSGVWLRISLQGHFNGTLRFVLHFFCFPNLSFCTVSTLLKVVDMGSWIVGGLVPYIRISNSTKIMDLIRTFLPFSQGMQKSIITIWEYHTIFMFYSSGAMVEQSKTFS